MITINKKDGTVESMTVEEFSRWCCLAEAFHFIEEKANLVKVDMFEVLKPVAIDAYIKERYLSMKHDVECEKRLGNI